MAIKSKLVCLLKTSIFIRKNTKKTILIVILIILIVIVDDGYKTNIIAVV